MLGIYIFDGRMYMPNIVVIGMHHLKFVERPPCA
jgi:hypothetical protein